MNMDHERSGGHPCDKNVWEFLSLKSVQLLNVREKL